MKDVYTPLHWAAQNGHTAAMELLIKQGANKEAKDEVSAPSTRGCVPPDLTPYAMITNPSPPLPSPLLILG